MKAPQEIKESVVTTIRSMDDEIRQAEFTLATHVDMVARIKKTIKSMKKARKEHFSFAKKIGITEEDIGKFTPTTEWNGEIPSSLTNEERNSKLAGIVDSWQSGEADA